MKDQEYRHYGAKKFRDITPIYEYEPNIMNKPRGGLWASPYGENFYTWKEWTNSEMYRVTDDDDYFAFKLKDTANILVIDNPDMVLASGLLVPDTYIPSRKCLDLPKIVSMYDGIELIHGDYFSLFHSRFSFNDTKYEQIAGMFNWWDCDSICIWNQDIIELI